MSKPKPEVVTFKADEALLDALKGIENRSEFIRNAVLTALKNTCPLCQGAGVLTPKQREHWERFARSHPVEECDDCHEMHLRCTAAGETARPVESPRHTSIPA